MQRNLIIVFNSRTPQQEVGVQPASLFSGAALKICQAIAICADLIKGAMEKELKFSRGTSADAYQDVANLLVEKKVQMLGIDLNFTCTST
ncbi:unnamed protein product [Sphagnum jensenii]|uniref:Uncharacterized protein n=1 Tax=Sphagnum jensenii TaxID=128206 RepID=A0ABP1B608_9BRYO